jgi:50S ribosomal protein L16 3-hydroxylase
MHWPAGLDARRFLADYWQQRPLVMKGALPGFESCVDGHDLAALACDPDVESRLVLHHPDDRWELRQGPFDEAEFDRLPARGWTLLVQDVDKHLQPVADVLTGFRFLPDWRLDDVMISFAAPGGSVGPHVDAYDVFLLQAGGSRRWSLDPSPADRTLRTDAPLRLLEHFEPTARHTLTPGDLLYLPPGVAHHGLGEIPSMTWSIGFRAPSVGDLLRELADTLDALEPAPRYADPGLDDAEIEPGHISHAALSRATALLEAAGHAGRATALACLGRAVTRSKPWLQPEPPEQNLSPDALAARLDDGARLRRHPAARMAWHAGVDAVWLFAEGETWRLPPDQVALARRCAAGEPLGPAQVPRGRNGALAVLAELHGRGCLELLAPEGDGLSEENVE